MALTLIGMILVPVTLACAVFWPSALLDVLVISSIFQAGSVVNGKVGGFEFGLPPFYFVACFIAVRYFFDQIITIRATPQFDVSTIRFRKYLLAFWAWAVASSFILPRVFDGFAVYSPREGIDEQYLFPTPMHWSFSNLAQAVFLTLDVIVILYVLRVFRTPSQINRAPWTFYYSIMVAASVGLLQEIALARQWSFPYEVLNSNPAYVQGFDQIVASWGRINSTFSEPSYAGCFLGAAAVGLLAAFLAGRRTVLHFMILVTVLMVLIGTTATTGYMAFAVATLGLFVFFSPLWTERPYRSVYARGWIAASILGLACGIYLSSNPDLLEAAYSMTVDKGETLSFIHRIAADAQAMTLVRDTYGLGVGLGSSRPSSLATALLSTVGIPGTFLFGALLYWIFKSFPRHGEPVCFHMTFWALVALVIAQVFSVPEINFPVLWALICLVVAQMSLRSAKGRESKCGNAYASWN